jgi:hypothetical protein
MKAMRGTILKHFGVKILLGLESVSESVSESEKIL